MTVSQTITYDTAANFTFNASEIAVTTAANLALITLASQTFTQSFDSSAGFTLSASLSEITGGQLQQIDQSPTDSVIGVNYATVVNANWNNDSVVTGTLNGSPVITAGKLVCTGAQGVSYVMNDVSAGAIKFLFTPNYTTSPPSNINLVGTYNGTNNNNRFILTHSPSGNTLRLTVADSTGSVVLSAATIGPAWTPTASTEYEFELNFDSAGVIDVFIDGVLHGGLTPTAWTRSTGASTLVIGATTSVYNQAEGSFNDVLYFDTVQHTAGYTAGYTVPDAKYLEDLITMPQFAYSGLGVVQSFDAFAATGTSTTLYNVNAEYWNGSAWVASDDSAGQMSTAADVLANIGTITVADTVDIKIRTTDNNTQENVSLLSITYSGQIYPTTDPVITNDVTVQADGLVSLTEVATKPSLTNVCYTIALDAIDYYHDGTSWIISDNTLAQSNTVSEVNVNASSLSFDVLGQTLQLNAILESQDGTVTPTLTSATFVYDFAPPAAVEISETIVYGRVRTVKGVAISGAVVVVKLESDVESADILVPNESVGDTVSDSTGYWEISIIPGTYTVIVNGSIYTTVIVPSQDSVSFNTIN